MKNVRKPQTARGGGDFLTRTVPYMMFRLYFFTNKMNDAMTNEIQLSSGHINHVTSLARASRSRVSKNRRGHFISVSRRLPARGVGSSECISIATSTVGGTA